MARVTEEELGEPSALDLSKFSPSGIPTQAVPTWPRLGMSLNRDELRSLLGWSGFRFQLKLVSWDRWTRTVLSRCDKNGDCAIDCMSL